jgi:capsular polysaccharide biosynthesis protein
MDDYIVGLNDVTCIPRQVLVCQEKLLPDTFRRRNSRLDHVQIERMDDQFRILVSDTPTRIIEDQCFFLDGEHADHFGHLTLEVLSRLWAFKYLELSNLKFIISARNLGLISALVEPFGISSDRLIQFRQPILCKKLIVASQSYVLENSASPNALAVWSKVGTHYARPNTPEKIYVSRRKWQKQRRLVNEEEVEKIFSDRGFCIIYPEEMSVPEQISFFRGAKFIAGPSGSGMYNTIYCTPGTKILILISVNFITLNDSLIHSLVNLETEYLAGKVIDKERGGMFDNWEIDLDLVRRHVGLI